MNVQIRHNSVNISSYVIGYEREHKICSGIGRLNVVLAITYPTSIEPWHTFDVWENGSFQVRYYVSDVVFSVPDATVTIECQDNSKRLVDYFIPDQYTVDYPSYTRYWIQKFLDEAGINYIFNTTSQGNLLSNFTSLGLTSGYDQIMQLLQLSGWYLYFDGNGVAIIGSLNKDLSSISGTYNKTDILNIAKISDDKMLRNRAVVWGAYNSLFQQYAFADLKTHTRWNYDHRDLRAIVISNSNIPNRASAIRIANILLKEFARITVEKHLTVVGASNKNLGDVVRVRSHVYNGTGMITTFGVSMGKDGLVTNLVLDERCPRLYGFFDFGDYVYVGTYGSGIWRKHIKFVHNWTNFSTGLTNLNITDLHINNDIFGSVAAGGEMYYNESSDSNWTPLTITGLMSSVEDQLEVGVEIISGVMGSGVMQATFSGIMGRATIIDKQSNTIKFGVDTWSGLNFGDYFLQFSGLITSSGILQSGVNRGWIVEHNPFEGTTEDFPISVSGNFNILVLDLENDGLNDYVSVRAGGGTLITGSGILQEYNYGYGGITEYREESKVSLSNVQNLPDRLVSSLFSGGFNIFSIGMVDNFQEHEIFYTRFFSGSQYSFTIRKYSTTNQNFALLSSTEVVLTSGKIPLGFMTAYDKQICKIGDNIYRFMVQTASSYEIVTITHLGAESYSVAYTVCATNDAEKTIARAVQNDTKVLVVYQQASGNNHKLWYSLIDLETLSISSPSLVYEAGGTTTNRKDLTHRQTGYYTGFQTIAWQSEWNSSTPTSRTVYSVYGIDFAVAKGSAQFTTNTTLSVGFNDHRLTRKYGRISAAVGSTIYFNYGIHGTGTSTQIIQWDSSTIINPNHDERIFRVLDQSQRSVGQSGLQYSDFPISDSSWVDIDLPNYDPITSFFFREDSVTESIFIFGRHKTDLTDHILGLNPDTFEIETNPRVLVSFTSVSDAEDRRVFNVGNMFCILGDIGSNSGGAYFVIYKNLNPPLGTGGRYLVLQREGFDYNIIQEASKPMRVDISNNSPVLTVQDYENTFVSNYIYGDILDQVITLTGLTGTEVRDYRYTLLESTVETEITPSGGATQTVLYVGASGVWGTSIEALASGFMVLYTIPSGFAERLETSNYIPSGQYIFVTTSGDSPSFYQKDPEDFFFTSYSGLPVSRATIIRVDDRF